MANRSADRLRPAEADMRHAMHAREAGDYDWACFAAHQAAEKALKAPMAKSYSGVGQPERSSEPGRLARPVARCAR